MFIVFIYKIVTLLICWYILKTSTSPGNVLQFLTKSVNSDGNWIKFKSVPALIICMNDNKTLKIKEHTVYILGIEMKPFIF